MTLKKPKEDEPNLILYQGYLDEKEKERKAEITKNEELDKAENDDEDKKKFDIKEFAFRFIPVSLIALLAIVLATQIFGSKYKETREVVSSQSTIATTNPNAERTDVQMLNETPEEDETGSKEIALEDGVTNENNDTDITKNTTSNTNTEASTNTVAPEPQIIEGIDGKDGATGATGAAGEKGERGANGASGRDGSDGKTGKAGKTAYAAAVEAGYTGTETEFAKVMAETPEKLKKYGIDLDNLNTTLNSSVLDLNNSLQENVITINGKIVDNVDALNTALGITQDNIDDLDKVLQDNNVTINGKIIDNAEALSSSLDTNVKQLNQTIVDSFNSVNTKITQVNDAMVTKTTSLEDDVNAIKENINTLSQELEETKKYVADGKALIAAAETEKGVETASDATFQTLADNISSIYTSGTVNGEKIAAGKLFPVFNDFYTEMNNKLDTTLPTNYTEETTIDTMATDLTTAKINLSSSVDKMYTQEEYDLAYQNGYNAGKIDGVTKSIYINTTLIEKTTYYTIHGVRLTINGHSQEFWENGSSSGNMIIN